MYVNYLAINVHFCCEYFYFHHHHCRHCHQHFHYCHCHYHHRCHHHHCHCQEEVARIKAQVQEETGAVGTQLRSHQGGVQDWD